MREGQEATNNNPKNAHGYGTYVDLIYTTQTQHEYVYVGRPTNYLVLVPVCARYPVPYRYQVGTTRYQYRGTYMRTTGNYLLTSTNYSGVQYGVRTYRYLFYLLLLERTTGVRTY
jgi:hypothetical protein